MLISSALARRALVCAFAATTFLSGAAADAAPLTPTDDVATGAVRAQRLVVSRRPASRAFVRFNLGAAPAAGFHAILYVYSFSNSAKGLVLRHASDRGWTERALSPMPRTGPRSVRSGPLRRGRWTSIDVTRLVNSSGVVSLALATAGTERVVLASREARRLSPRLEFGYGPAPTVVKAPSLGASTVTPVPTAGGGSSTPSPASSAVTPPSATTPPPAAVPPPPPPPPPPPAPQPTPAKPCGVTSTAPTWRHVIWIVMENHSYSQAMGTSATPFTNSLAAKCGSATNMSAEARPSLPNYIAMTSGGTQGIADNNPPASHPLNVPSIFSLTNGDWRSPQEGMPSNCAQNSSGSYAVKHNPAAYYTNIRSECDRLDVPMTDPVDVSAKFTLITPNMCNSTHDCGVGTGDTWLSKYVTQIINSAAYASGTTALFLTWDEGSGDQHIATVVVSPSTRPGTADATTYNHYSMLRATEEMLGLSPLLGAAARATSMRAGFNL